MGFKCGFVGLPNVGKSTIFNAVTNAGAQAANYPFCTIEPNVGMVAVPDPRLDELAKVHNPKQVVPAVIQFVDIAGLVEGASKGEGLGNQFLTHIREVDAILHVVRCFENPDITHVAGSIDPIRDADIIETELILKDMDSVEKKLLKEQKISKTSGDKTAKARVVVLEKIAKVLDEGKSARSLNLETDELALIQDLALLTLKPLFFCANISEEDIGTTNPHVEALQKFAKENSAEVIPVCGKIEEELAEMDSAEKNEFLTELGLSESGLDAIIRKGYEILGLRTFFTAGEKECKAWTFHNGDKAPQCAGVIHTDFERGFIRAETLSYADFLKYGSWNAAKEHGALRTEGKEYVAQDGDIMVFLFNV